MDATEAVFRKLLQIQKKYSKYFIDNNTTVFDCVQIVWEPLTLFILNKNLPPEIRDKIEDIPKSI